MTLWEKKSRSGVGINIVPLVDVLTVLIFFILMTMQFKNNQLLDITPPKMDTAGQGSENDDVKVAIDKEGGLYFNDKLMTEQELLDALMLVDAQRGVMVLADQTSELMHTAFVMDATRKAGLARVRLQVR